MICLILALMLLCGCQAAPVPETTAAGTVPETTDAGLSAFTGDFDRYVPRYTGRWESTWEADILFLAEKYLTEHSYLCDANFFIEYQPDLSGNNEVVYENSAFDPEKRQAFIEAVDALLAAIPELTDEQIHCELLRMVAAIGDIHSNYWSNSERMLPLFYQPFFREDGVDYRVVTVRRGSEKLLMAKLVSINGIPVAELVERVSAYVAHESDRALPFQLTGAWEISALSDHSILSAAGIIGPEDRNVKMEFETEKGISEERVAFRTVDEIISTGLTVHPMESDENLRYRNTESYWWTMIDEQTLYMQLTTMMDDSGYTIDNLFSEVRTAMRDSEVPLKIILDFRGNGGGYVHEATLQGFVNATEWYEHDGVYILIDGNCFSAGVLAPYYLRQAVEGAKLVGAPTGQGLWFPSNSAWYELPNNGTGFSVGDEIICAVRGWEGDALEPDVTVYQTAEDYDNMIDSVIAWVMAD